MYTPAKMERFERNVLSKYNVYNSVFLTLPFDAIDNTGAFLPLFTEVCEKGFAKQETPEQIVDFFVGKYLDNPTEKERIDLMFRFIQYIERQIVLFDAIEDAAFPVVNNLEGKGSLREVRDAAETDDLRERLKGFLDEFKVRTVLTAHPTQFYPGSVLGIITDLTEAVRTDNLYEIKRLLSQLGKTPFLKKEKPTPFDEAVSLVWYLENVFYDTCGDIVDFLCRNVYQGDRMKGSILSLGFWPGGDRDGNPFVTTEITYKVADRLRTSILKCYYRDMRKLRRKITFSKVEAMVIELESKIYRSAFSPEGELFLSPDEFKSALLEIRKIIVDQHQSLYVEEVDSLLNKLQVFGFHFASLDIRQNSHIHNAVIEKISHTENSDLPQDYIELDEQRRMEIASLIHSEKNTPDLGDELANQTLDSMKAMREIQQKSGELACNRYIISNNESALNVLETLAMFKLSGWQNPSVDIVPLFEAVEDLRRADKIMEQLYTNPEYARHLENRNKTQTVMLGFSDGTKDGGYLMANWSIYKAKETITAMSRKYGIKVIFFDGRGGPPARGGGKTHKFYASLGSQIENHEIQLTIQGQTISSNFGTEDSCRYNLENLLSAGINNGIFDKGKNDLSEDDKKLLDDLSELGYKKYTDFKNHPKFLPFLQDMSALKYYSMLNIGSRPAKRNKGSQLNFGDLRAIPFVGAWSMLKINVPGFFGVGAALKAFEENGRWKDVQELFDRSLFFRTLLENSMMSLAKSFMPLTAYMKDDAEFGEFWTVIFDEYQETKRLLLKIAGHATLMENYPDGKASIDIREHIVLPLLVIQQYSLQRINEIQKQPKPDENLIAVYEKLVTRALFGNTNASRNSA
ncbi:phosphoenolpyruvate carboxylase [Flavobacterium sp. MAH-1]|uniref:Phosphoenolpyruvate carboxylase n=1 Tax=Flavobacterium agri TaxID=2743471 RepID=A0A7Y8XZX9_9FLAO|nr:phosphoenolpyruvate carboxylase [Flavobacterium agri]NUY79822.1 phosphoenolpyruvate carboxylase [Flavobacterium agri]NYA69847.1 phosphoenolpyruvate carboxylase [Flavobacterium agri]